MALGSKKKKEAMSRSLKYCLEKDGGKRRK